MKKQFLSLLFVAVALILTSCGPSKDDAITWNNSIVSTEDEVSSAVDAFFNAVDVQGSDLNKECDKAIAVADAGLAKMKGLEDFKDGADLKSAGVESLTLFQSILKNECKQMISLLANPNATEEDFAKVKEHLVSTAAKIDAVDAKFTDAQKKFADKWGFKLESK